MYSGAHAGAKPRVPPFFLALPPREPPPPREALELAPSVLRALTSYAWPGNIRELENEVQRWVALCAGGVAVEDLSPAIAGTPLVTAFDPDDLRLRPRIEAMERELIGRALEATGNNQTKAAERLGLSRYGLQKKLKRLQEDA